MSAPYRDEKVLLPDEALVAFGNRLLEAAGTDMRIESVRIRDYDHFVFDGVSRGRPASLVAPTCEFRNGYMGFRSILQVVSPSKPHTWLPNGQASRNTREIVFHGEEGPRLAASRDSYAAWVRSGFEENISAQRRAFFDAQTAEVLSGGLYGDDFEIVENGERRPLAMPTEAALAL